MSHDATAAEIEFLKSLRFGEARPTPLYFYRELQNLRDPLHFTGAVPNAMHRRRDSGKADKQMRLNSRRNAIQRWTRNKPTSPGKNSPKTS